MISRTQLSDELAAIRDQKQALQETKNRNYAKDGDAFANLSLIEHVTNGEVTTEQGIFIRVLDKVSRLATLLFYPNVKDEVGESIEDTWMDLSVYAELAIVDRRNKEDRLETPPPVEPSEAPTPDREAAARKVLDFIRNLANKAA